MRKTAPLLYCLIASCALLAACESTTTKKTATLPAPTAPPPPTTITEAPAPYRAQLHTEIAAGFYERGQMEVALQELAEAVKLDPKNGRIYNVYGLIYTMLGQDAKAEQNFQQALALAPDDSEIRQNWGWYLCTHGRAKDSIPEFEMAVSNPLYKTPDVSLINAGKCSVEIGDNKRAEEFFRRALSVNPNNAVAAYNMSLLAYRLARLDDARALMKRVMAQNNPPADALFLGMCIERKMGDHASEASYVSQLKNRYPESAEARAIPTGDCE